MVAWATSPGMSTDQRPRSLWASHSWASMVSTTSPSPSVIEVKHQEGRIELLHRNGAIFVALEVDRHMLTHDGELGLARFDHVELSEAVDAVVAAGRQGRAQGAHETEYGCANTK